MKRIVAGSILVFLTVVLVYLFFFRLVSRTQSAVEEDSYEVYDRHYVMITGDDDSSFWDQVYESALAAGRAAGVYVERFGANLAVEYDCSELLQLAVDASVDGIIVPGAEDEETVALLDEAVECGIPVVTVLRDSPGSLRQCFVGNNSYNLGQDYGRQVLKILEEDEPVEAATDAANRTEARVLVLVDETRKDTSQNLILLGIRETLERELGEAHGISVETMSVDDTRSFSAEESIRDIFLNSGELPDILICLSAVHTQCAYQAVVDYNLVGAVQLLGYYDSEAILNAVSKNIIYTTIVLDTDQMGRFCVQALEEYVKTGYTNSYMAVDTRLITAEDAVRAMAEEE